MANDIRTYAGLKQQIKDTLKRPKFDDEIDVWIQLAESRFVPPKLKIRELRARAVALANEEYEKLPDDYQDMDSVYILEDYSVDDQDVVTWGGVKREIDFKTESQLIKEFPRNTGTVGQGYSINAYEIHFRPFSTPFYYEVNYYQMPSTIIDGSTNDILIKYPALYLYGALMEGAPFIGNDPRIATWEKGYDAMLVTLNEKTGEFSSGGLSAPTSQGFNP